MLTNPLSRDAVYPSKVDLWVAGLLALTFGIMLVTIVMMVLSGSPGDLVAAVVTGVILLAIGLILFPVRYTIGAEELVIRSGVWKIRIPLDQIFRAYPSRSLMSSPALSLDRLAIEYRMGPYSRPTVYISPVRRDEFLERLALAADLELRGGVWKRRDV